MEWYMLPQGGGGGTCTAYCRSFDPCIAKNICYIRVSI